MAVCPVCRVGPIVRVCRCDAGRLRMRRRSRDASMAPFLIPADVAFIVIESIAAIALLVSAKNIDSAAFASLMDGALSIPFWIGFVACGIVLPFIAEMILLFAGRGALASTAAVLAVLVLVGGLCLRISIVACGVAPLM